MVHAVESRVSFLDHHLVKYVNTLPSCVSLNLLSVSFHDITNAQDP
jgi:hypothetical protein